MNNHMNKAKKAKNDELYTLIKDIEKELSHYKDQFKDKIVYCNCDNPNFSNFWKYFKDNFNELKLKKLIATYFVREHGKYKLLNNSKEDIYSYKWEINKDNKEIIKTKLFGNGDFRSKECIEILEEIDIVCTNPPFSLFREYVDLLVKYDKKFLIIGCYNAVTYKNIFKLIKDNRLWLGYQYIKEFLQIDGTIKNFGNIHWFTNLNVKEHHKSLELTKSYYTNPDYYPKYDNYNAINIDKIKDIPYDYNEDMGVPISFLDYYNPKQFKIIALGIVGSIEFTSNRKMEILDKYGNSTGKFTFNAKGFLYRNYNSVTDKHPGFRDIENNKLYVSPYSRIIIRKIK